MKQEEQTQEDARKCGDLLLVAEAMLEIVNEHNRDTFPPLEVRIGALCCAFCVSCRAATVERTGLLFSVSHINPNPHIKQNLICVCACMLMDAHALTLSLSLSLSLSQRRYWYWERGGRYAWRAEQALLCARSIEYD